jgi:hypothetical protein
MAPNSPDNAGINIRVLSRNKTFPIPANYVPKAASSSPGSRATFSEGVLLQGAFNRAGIPTKDISIVFSLWEVSCTAWHRRLEVPK